jgi:hypothetical protein
MRRTYSSGRLSIMLCFLGAIAAGTAFAFALAPHASSSPARVFATNHCTRYEPNTSPDTSCGVNGSLSGGFGVTQSVALRDNNQSYFSSSHCWELFYDHSNTYPPQPPREHDAGGCGLMGNIGHNSDGLFRYSWCLFDPSGGTGRCVTFWHD